MVIILTKIIAMVLHILTRNKTIIFLLALTLLSSCYSSKQVTCPDIDTYHPQTRRYKKHISLAWNRSGRISKKSVLIRPAIKNSVEKDNADDMTILVSRPGEEILSDKPGFLDMEPVRSGDQNTLMVSGDATFTGPSEIIVFDEPSNLSQAYNPPSKKEVREIRREFRRDMKSELRSSKPMLSHTEDSIMLFAVTSFVLGIIGIFTMPLLLGILATIFGAVALSMIRREGVYEGKGLAMAGLILGIVLLVVGIILLPFAILGMFI